MFAIVLVVLYYRFSCGSTVIISHSILDVMVLEASIGLFKTDSCSVTAPILLKAFCCLIVNGIIMQLPPNCSETTSFHTRRDSNIYTYGSRRRTTLRCTSGTLVLIGCAFIDHITDVGMAGSSHHENKMTIILQLQNIMGKEPICTNSATFHLSSCSSSSWSRLNAIM